MDQVNTVLMMTSFGFLFIIISIEVVRLRYYCKEEFNTENTVHNYIVLVTVLFVRRLIKEAVVVITTESRQP